MFWNFLNIDSSNIAVIDETGRAISYGELVDRIETAAQHLRSLGERRFGLFFASNTLNSLVAYLACLQARHVPLLLSGSIAPELASFLQTHYQPSWLLGSQAHGERLMGADFPLSVLSQTSTPPSLGPDLALLLSTSGSTGSPKLVRLSYGNLEANASSIAQFLGLTPNERALTVLPPHYSYGLSVIHSHLHAGACLVLREVSVLSSAFADTIRAHEATSLSGVPYIYQMLWRTGFNKQNFPSLRTITQAGGRLDDRLTGALAKLAIERDWRFFVMYGQTEATARISYVPPNRLVDKVGSIGIAIPGGQLHVDPQNSELVYSGPNVMLGYANCRDDLALGDEQQGLLRTGDIACQDDEGFFYITGRLKRFIKLAGNRIGLDELEQSLQLKLTLPVMLSGKDERLVVWLESSDETVINDAMRWLSSQYGIHHSMCRLRLIEALPMLSSGKKDYAALLSDI